MTTNQKLESNFIRIYEKAIPDKVCDKLIKRLLNPNSNVAKRRNESSHLTSTDFFLSNNESDHVLRKLYDQISSLVKTYLEVYKKDITDDGGGLTLNFCTRFEQPRIVRYSNKNNVPEKFNDHSDNWSTDSSTRQVNIIMYLNDVDEGGATVFPYYNLSVKPEKGKLLMFPSFYTYTHRGEVPVSHSKFILVTWLHFGNETKYTTYPLMT